MHTKLPVLFAHNSIRAELINTAPDVFHMYFRELSNCYALLRLGSRMPRGAISYSHLLVLNDDREMCDPLILQPDEWGFGLSTF